MPGYVPGYVTAWVVSTGSYSDYRVQAVFATKAQAERAIAVAATAQDVWHHDYMVEEMPFYPAGSEAGLVTSYERRQDLWDNGEQGILTATERTEPEFDTLHGYPPKRPVVRFVRAPFYQGKGGRLEVRGAGRTAVDKAFNDRYMQWKSEH